MMPGMRIQEEVTHRAHNGPHLTFLEASQACQHIIVLPEHLAVQALGIAYPSHDFHAFSMSFPFSTLKTRYGRFPFLGGFGLV